MNRTGLATVWPPTAAVAKTAGHRPTSPMQAIRRKCLDCCADQIAEVRLCETITFALWPFRAGVHPYTKTRLQEADTDAVALRGILVPENSSLARTGVLEALGAEDDGLSN